MKIEVGKSYRTRDGRNVKIGRFVGEEFPFEGKLGGDNEYWRENGRWSLAKDKPNKRDLISEWEEPAADPLLKTAKIFDDIPQPSYKYADMSREEDLTVLHSEQATTVFRWLDPCEAGGLPPVLQQKFIILTMRSAGDVPLQTIEWRTIPTVSG